MYIQTESSWVDVDSLERLCLAVLGIHVEDIVSSYDAILLESWQHDPSLEQ